MAAVRVLVVDDHEVARRGIRAVLAGDHEIEIVAEVGDGESAVQKALEAHPDIVLLDISLPGMSGIEAARQIIKSSPKSRIIFVSQHDSLLLANDTLHAGGSAYVVKSDAGRDLLSAIQAVQQGHTFLSRSLAARREKASPATD